LKVECYYKRKKSTGDNESIAVIFFFAGGRGVRKFSALSTICAGRKGSAINSCKKNTNGNALSVSRHPRKMKRKLNN